ncbi:YgfZ/GcvT domain-containing protein [Edaphobacter modestus]|nr:folate-binding protein YgfZ [Edaphobacter modestus]
MTPAATSNPPSAVPPGVPASGSHPQLNALLSGVGITPLEKTGWIRVTGSDRVRWLNGMATNSVQDLAVGSGAYNFFLNAQGRIQGDGNIFASSDALLIETSRPQTATLIPYLDHYIIMDDVELADISDSRYGLSVIGPEAPSLLAKLGLPAEALKEFETREELWNSAPVMILRAHSPLVPRYELWAERADTVEAVRKALEDLGATACDLTTLDWLRILEGTPLFGTDIRDRDLPQETNQARAMHFNKGCYLGQEIVERIRSRGSVHRTFTAFVLEGTLPESSAPVESGGKQVGELTSAAAIPISGSHGSSLQLALGYVRREALDRNDRLQFPGGIAHPISSPFFATATELPSPAPDSSKRD